MVVQVCGACASGGSAAPPTSLNAAMGSAPNGSLITATVVEAVIVESAALGIEPSQRLCVLTLSVTSAKTVDNLLPAVPQSVIDAGPIRVYSKQTELVSLKGGSLTASITSTGDDRAARLWLTEVIASAPKLR